VGGSPFHGRFIFDARQPNILVSKGTPHRVCLTNFDFFSAVLDPDQKLSCSAQMVGGTMRFLSPELLVPEMEGAKSTPPADIYAFGLVIFQVCNQDFGYQPVYLLSP